MPRIEGAAFAHFCLRRSDITAPDGMVTLSRDTLEEMHRKSWTFPVAALPVKISVLETTPDYTGPLHIVRDITTDLGNRGLRAMLKVTHYFPPALSMGMADPQDKTIMAKADLLMDGLVPPIGFRGVLLNTVTTDGDVLFQEYPADYDAGQYRRAGLPSATHPTINAVPDVPPAPDSM